MTRIDRRALFTSGAAAALLAASGVSAKARPSRGGVLRMAVPRDGSLARIARGAAFDGLTEIGPDGILRPDLALAWQSNPGATEWTFGLRRDARFSDGTPFQARHVSTALGALPDLQELRVLDAHSLQVTLSRGNPDLPVLLADAAFAIGLPLDGTEYGTGVYHVTRMDEVRHLQAMRVAQHYKDGHAGWADRIDVVVIPDPVVRAEALRDGYVDLAYLPDATVLDGSDRYQFHPAADRLAIAARHGVGIPPVVSARSPLDDGRIAARWWIA
ncbi:ABC transporter substrate-binding protein [Albibacillus kandeliae]|uniref:ABC transporter substrate-binding protein n=1 Tax=Albibacillus kandeliae TaxID=2174228 RepID=UPI000D68FAA3|nr:ABC transporter substrate-binding protein [Albibacillus kandeliae]